MIFFCIIISIPLVSAITVTQGVVFVSNDGNFIIHVNETNELTDLQVQSQSIVYNGVNFSIDSDSLANGNVELISENLSAFHFIAKTNVSHLPTYINATNMSYQYLLYDTVYHFQIAEDRWYVSLDDAYKMFRFVDYTPPVIGGGGSSTYTNTTFPIDIKKLLTFLDTKADVNTILVNNGFKVLNVSFSKEPGYALRLNPNIVHRFQVGVMSNDSQSLNIRVLNLNDYDFLSLKNNNTDELYLTNKKIFDKSYDVLTIDIRTRDFIGDYVNYVILSTDDKVFVYPINITIVPMPISASLMSDDLATIMTEKWGIPLKGSLTILGLIIMITVVWFGVWYFNNRRKKE